MTVIGTAGCLESATDSPESVVEEYYAIINDVEEPEDIDDAIEAIDNISHSISPLVDFLEPDEEEAEDVNNISVDNVETEIVDQNLSAEEIQHDVGFFLERDDIEEIVAHDNALVEASVEQSGEDAAEEHRTREWLVAKDDGDWLIVF